MNRSLSLFQRSIAEAAGTGLLVLMGPGAAAVDVARPGTITHLGVAAAFALAVMSSIVIFGPVSGSHINPAVTIALWLKNRIPTREVPAYLIAQCLGATLAAMAIRGVLGDAVQAAATVPSIPTGQALAVEMVLSAILMAVIVAVIRGEYSTSTSAVLIGLTVGLCALVGGPLTGASMNPARTLGPALASGLWTGHWLYWAGPIAGMTAVVGLTKGMAQREA